MNNSLAKPEVAEGGAVANIVSKGKNELVLCITSYLALSNLYLAHLVLGGLFRWIGNADLQ